MAVGRPARGTARPGHSGDRLSALALRITVIVGAAAAAYVALTQLDRAAYADDGPARPGLIGGVINVVAAVPRSLAGPGPSASDRTGDPATGPRALRGAAASTPAPRTAPRPGRPAGTPRPPAVATPGGAVAVVPTRPATADIARATGRDGAPPTRRADAPTRPVPATLPPPGAPAPVVAAPTGSLTRALAEIGPPPVDVIPLSAVTGPLLAEVPTVLLDVLTPVVELAVTTTDLLDPPPVTVPTLPRPGAGGSGTTPPAVPAAPPPSAPRAGAPGAARAPRPPVPPPAVLAAPYGPALPCCNAVRPGDRAHGAARVVAARDLRDRPDAPAPLRGPGVGAHGVGGPSLGGGCQPPALPAAAPWRADSAFVSTSRPGHALRRGRSPAVPALPG